MEMIANVYKIVMAVGILVKVMLEVQATHRLPPNIRIQNPNLLHLLLMGLRLHLHLHPLVAVSVLKMVAWVAATDSHPRVCLRVTILPVRAVGVLQLSGYL